MPELVLKFKLPDEKSDAEMAQRAGDWYCAVYDVATELRNRLKHAENPSKELEEFSDWFWGMLKDRGIDPYEA